jgi:hypothetical protein
MQRTWPLTGLSLSLSLALFAGACSRPKEDAVWASIKPGPGESLPPILKVETAKAAQKRLVPVVYVGATWDMTSMTIKQSRHDPLMRNALQGTYVIDLNIDDWEEQDLEVLGFKAGVVPYFYMVDGEGRSTGRTIQGGWGETVPANMAPRLKAFLSR